MSKRFVLLSILMLMLGLVLIACSSESTNTENGTSNKEETPSAVTKEEGTQQKEEMEPVVITYASWASAELEEQRIAAFEARHPHIKVVRDESITWPWDETLAAAAAAGTLPDVMWLFSVPPSVMHGWAADLTPFLEADPEYNAENIFGNLSATGNINGGQYALPHGLFASGIFLNLDVMEQENVPVPTASWSLDEMRRTAIQLTKFNERQFGFEGARALRETLIPQFDPSQGWLTWDGEQYNFDKPAFADSIRFVNDFMYNDKVSHEIYTQEERNEWYGQDNQPWLLGKVGMRYGHTWDFAGFHQDLDFRWDIRPIPGVNGQRIPLVTDYMAMSSSSEQKEAAFEFIKWMTYSKEGWLDRIELEKPIASIPIINDQEVWTAYLQNEHVPAGMRDILLLVSDGFVDGWKWLPGFQEVMTQIVGPTYEQLEHGTLRPEDVAQDFQKRSNESYHQAMSQINR